MRRSTPPATGSGTTRITGVSKKRVSSGRRLVARGMPAPRRWTTTTRSSPVTAYSSGRSLRTITIPPAEGRNPIPVIDARCLAVALAGAVAGAGAAAGGGEAELETVGREARARSTSSRDAAPPARATRRSRGAFGGAGVSAGALRAEEAGGDAGRARAVAGGGGV